MPDPDGAVLSDDGVYRYALWRTWSAAAGAVAFIGLNPSTADAIADDPTVRRCRAFATEWGYGCLYLGNLHAYRATNPDVLPEAAAAGVDVFGPDNDAWLFRMCANAGLIIACWGAHPYGVGGLDWLKLIAPGRSIYCLGQNKDGSPRHPVRLPGDVVPELYYNPQAEVSSDGR